MKKALVLFALVGFCAARSAEHYAVPGEPPVCHVDGAGHTQVFYNPVFHLSFKCTHAGTVCSCTLKHPTHDQGGCKQLESKAAGKLLNAAGDCTDSGKNTPAPTPAPTPPPYDVSTVTSGFKWPLGITVDSVQGFAYVCDNHAIHKVDLSSGAITTAAGSPGTTGTADGLSTIARFNRPISITLAAGIAYITDWSNHAIRKLDMSSGTVTTLAGAKGTSGSSDGTGTGARFYKPNGIAVDDANRFAFVTDQFNQVIRKIDVSSGAVTTLAGSPGSKGFVNGGSSAARFNQPMGILVDNGFAFVADRDNNAIRKVDVSNGYTTTLAGSETWSSSQTHGGNHGYTDGTGNTARFYQPVGITLDASEGVAYVCDTKYSIIRKVDLSSGAVTTVAGLAGATGATDGNGSSARFDNPYQLTADIANRYTYIVDYKNKAVRRMTLPYP